MNKQSKTTSPLSERERDAIEFEEVNANTLNKMCDTCRRLSMQIASDNNKIQEKISIEEKPSTCNDKVQCAELGKSYCKKMMQILIDEGFALDDIAGVFVGDIDPATLKMSPDDREINKDISSIGISKGYDPRQDRRNTGNPLRKSLRGHGGRHGMEEGNMKIRSRNSSRGPDLSYIRSNSGDDPGDLVEYMNSHSGDFENVNAKSNEIFTKMSKSDWLRIGKSTGWIKGAQGKEEFWETLAKEVGIALNQEHVKSVAKKLAEKMVKNNITDIDKMDKMDKEIEIFANAILGMVGFSKDNAYSICRNEAEAESYFGDALFSTKEDVKYEIYKHIRILMNAKKNKL